MRGVVIESHVDVGGSREVIRTFMFIDERIGDVQSLSVFGTYRIGITLFGRLALTVLDDCKKEC